MKRQQRGSSYFALVAALLILVVISKKHEILRTISLEMVTPLVDLVGAAIIRFARSKNMAKVGNWLSNLCISLSLSRVVAQSQQAGLVCG